MSFAFSKVAQRKRGVVSDVEVPMSRFYGAAWEAGVHESIFASVSRISEQYLEKNDTLVANLFGFYNGPMIEPSDAELRAKDRGLSIKFDKPISQNELNLIIDRHEKRRKRDFYLSRGEGMHNISGFGVQMAASMTNPVDFALMFVPIVGQSKMAKGMAMAGRGPARRALARGLITQESIAARGIKHPWLAESAIEGSVGQLIVEIPYSISEVASKTDYGPTDFMVNLVAGAGFATAFRGSLEGAARIFRKTSQKTQEVMFRRAIDNFAKGEDIDVAKFVELDEQRLREQAVFDEVNARQRAKEQVGDIEKFESQVRPSGIGEQPDGDTIILYHGTDPENIDGILKEGLKGQFTISLTDDMAIASDYGDSIISVKLTKSDFIELAKATKESAEEQMDMGAPPTETTKALIDGDYDKLWNLTKSGKFDMGEYIVPSTNIDKKAISHLGTFTKKQIRKRARQLRENAIKKFIREERKKFDPEAKYQRIRAQEIARQQAEGRVLSDEQVNKFSSKERVEDSDILAVEKDIQNLEEELKVEGKSDAATLREAKKPGPAMIEAATNCLRNNG